MYFQMLEHIFRLGALRLWVLAAVAWDDEPRPSATPEPTSTSTPTSTPAPTPTETSTLTPTDAQHLRMASAHYSRPGEAWRVYFREDEVTTDA